MKAFRLWDCFLLGAGRDSFGWAFVNYVTWSVEWFGVTCDKESVSRNGMWRKLGGWTYVTFLYEIYAHFTTWRTGWVWIFRWSKWGDEKFASCSSVPCCVLGRVRASQAVLLAFGVVAWKCVAFGCNHRKPTRFSNDGFLFFAVGCVNNHHFARRP